jgi:mono/diheme cytochrome c family protein
LALSAYLWAEDRSAVERGKRVLQERSFMPGNIPVGAYDEVWRIWDPAAKDPPADFDALLRERYGMHIPPYPNGRYPMGLREETGLFGKVVATDCLLCHAGSILGKSVIGLGNCSLDLHAFFEEMAAAQGSKVKMPIQFCNVRGTSEAGATAVFLLSLRQPDLKLRSEPLDFAVHDDMCEDTPAWWLLKKKKTMYQTGGADARSVRSLMQFMLTPLNTPSMIEREEATFRDIQAYLLSLEPPKYPFPIDANLVRKGESLFAENCSRCHGTYGEHWTYPNRIIPLNEIGTDRARFDGISEGFVDYFNQSWFGHEQKGWLGDDYRATYTPGYQAPPLDGVWATAPYFHNGSAPTVYHVLNSKARPTYFTRSYRTDEEAYDKEKLGWKTQVLTGGADPKLPALERRKIYDTTQPGRSNAGHTFGDRLTEDERSAIIEYLKTL